MRQEFQRRQQELVSLIVSQFPGLQDQDQGQGQSKEVPWSPGRRRQTDSSHGGLLPGPHISQTVLVPQPSQQLTPLSPASSRISEFTTTEPAGISLSSTISADPAIPLRRRLHRSGSPVQASPILLAASSRQEEVEEVQPRPPVELWPAPSPALPARPPVAVPPAALDPALKPAWTRLTALARGWLVRRLLRTEKVRSLRAVVREAVACAVALHRETAGRAPAPADLALHGRLLAQVEAACHALHHIFITLDTPARMSVIALDRSAASQKAARPALAPHSRVSSATAARLAARTAAPPPSHAPSPHSERRGRAVREAANIRTKLAALNTGHGNRLTAVSGPSGAVSSRRAGQGAGSQAGSRRSPRPLHRATKKQRSGSGSRRNVNAKSLQAVLSSKVLQQPKPGWK